MNEMPFWNTPKDKYEPNTQRVYTLFTFKLCVNSFLVICKYIREIGMNNKYLLTNDSFSDKIINCLRFA